MNKRLLAVFAFALAVASITSLAIYRLLLTHVAAPSRPVSMTKLVVASHDLQVGTLIKDSDLAEVSINGPMSDQAIKTRQEAVGRGVIATIYSNEPILDHRLAPKGAGAGLAATIPVGMRAVALSVNDVVGLAGFVVPGMRVDVLVAGSVSSSDGTRTGTQCRTVLQNIEVLSAGQKIARTVEGKPESAQVVNLLVTPDQAEVLNLASGETKVQLVLRNPLDTKEEVTHGASLAKLLGQDEGPISPSPVRFVPPSVSRARVAVPKQPEKEPEMATVEVFSGTKRSEQRFDSGAGK
jgi:pilus assembly protein CpaB